MFFGQNSQGGFLGSEQPVFGGVRTVRVVFVVRTVRVVTVRVVGQNSQGFLGQNSQGCWSEQSGLLVRTVRVVTVRVVGQNSQGFFGGGRTVRLGFLVRTVRDFLGSEQSGIFLGQNSQGCL